MTKGGRRKNVTRSSSVAVSKETLSLWQKYEDVAMHFNELIMRWRLLAIGGLAGLVTVAGFVVGDASSVNARYLAMLILSLVLACGWLGVAVIDLFYYRRLLHGAVKAILELEAQFPDIALSTRIEDEAQCGSIATPWVFYCAGLLPLLTVVGYAFFQVARL